MANSVSVERQAELEVFAGEVAQLVAGSPLGQDPRHPQNNEEVALYEVYFVNAMDALGGPSEPPPA